MNSCSIIAWLVLIHGCVCQTSYDMNANVSHQGRFENIQHLPIDNALARRNNCEVWVFNNSIKYFRSQLERDSSQFIRFRIVLLTTEDKTKLHRYNATSDTIRPYNWVWTYIEPYGNVPYLNWPIDYGLLSFGLLDAKTSKRSKFSVYMDVPSACPVNYGNRSTTLAIANAFLYLTARLTDKPPDEPNKYQISYYCYLAEVPGARDTLQYLAALYFLFPIDYINYNCCTTNFNYTLSNYKVMCMHKQMEKWNQCLIVPYILGIIIFLYFPIILFEFAELLSKDTKVVEIGQCRNINDCFGDISVQNSVTEQDRQPITYHQEDAINANVADETGWLYLDGNSPLTFFDIFGAFWCGLNHRFPVAVSRIKRMLFVLMAPCIIYLQLYMYYRYFNKYLPDLLKHGTPMGFLSLLGTGKEEINDTFAPLLGGPKCILAMNFLLGIVFLVSPSSLKQIVANGMPLGKFNTMLCLSFSEIRNLSMAPVKPLPGYKNCAILCKCSIYMLFTKQFWARVWTVQKTRYTLKETTKMNRRLKIILLPMYVCLCLLEILLCLVYYGVPLCTFISVFVKGATRSLSRIKEYHSRSGLKVFAILTNPFSMFWGTVIVLAMFLFYSYCFSLVFIQSFSFLSQIAVFCFIAVIVQPSVSFGYLFFFVALIYYIVRMLRGFGEVYLELLYEAVDISKSLDGQPNYFTAYEGHLVVSNLHQTEIKTLRINGVEVELQRNILHSILSNNKDKIERVRMQQSAWGIPKKLFEYLVRKHRPVHQQILKVIFQLSLIIFLIVTTMGITNKYVIGPTSDVSKVMHVIFTVTVGALPRVLEVALSSADGPIKREIETKNLERSIVEFWQIEMEKQEVGSA